MFNNFIEKINKKYFLIIFVVLIMACVGVFFVINSNKSVEKPEVPNFDNNYVCLDDKVLDNSDLKEWKDDKKNKQGAFIAYDGQYTYVLISYGETNETNISLYLEDVKFGKYIDVEYSILKGKYSTKTDNYIPKTLLLRFNGTNRDIKFNQSEKK